MNRFDRCAIAYSDFDCEYFLHTGKQEERMNDAISTMQRIFKGNFLDVLYIVLVVELSNSKSLSSTS